MDLDDLLGIDATAPDVVDAREDTAEFAQLIGTLVAHRRAVMTQAAVAEHMHTTQSAVSKIETLGGDPRISTLQRYARAVGGRLRLRCTVDGGGATVDFSVRPVSDASTFYRPRAIS